MASYTTGLANTGVVDPSKMMESYLQTNDISNVPYKPTVGVNSPVTGLSTTGLSGIDPKLQNQYMQGLINQQEGVMGTGMSGMDMLGAGTQIGSLGLGLASYFDNVKTADKQRALLDQQIASNRDLLSTRKARAGDISKAFGGGLAASNV